MLERGRALLEYRDIYAGGRLVGSASPDVITIVNPATEEVVGAVPSAVGVDVDKAVRSARRAFDDGKWATRARPPTGPTRSTGSPRPSRPAPRRRPASSPPRWGCPSPTRGSTTPRRRARSCATTRAWRARMDTEETRDRGELHRADRDPPRAGRRRRGDRQLELPDHARVQPARPGPRRRVHDRAQARRGDQPVGVHPGRGVRGRRLPARRVQPGHRHAPDRGPARPAPRRGHRGVLRARPSRAAGSPRSAAPSSSRRSLELGGQSAAIVLDDADLGKASPRLGAPVLRQLGPDLLRDVPGARPRAALRRRSSTR